MSCDNRVRTICWNVNGLGEKRQDTDFIEIISQYDMVCLTETWSSVKTNVKIKGFEKLFHHFRHKCRKRGTDLGVFLFTLKNILLKGLRKYRKLMMICYG